jgi:hypothetical protein
MLPHTYFSLGLVLRFGILIRFVKVREVFLRLSL